MTVVPNQAPVQMMKLIEKTVRVKILRLYTSNVAHGFLTVQVIVNILKMKMTVMAVVMLKEKEMYMTLVLLEVVNQKITGWNMVFIKRVWKSQAVTIIPNPVTLLAMKRLKIILKTMKVKTRVLRLYTMNINVLDGILTVQAMVKITV